MDCRWRRRSEKALLKIARRLAGRDLRYCARSKMLELRIWWNSTRYPAEDKVRKAADDELCRRGMEKQSMKIRQKRYEKLLRDLEWHEKKHHEC